LQIYANAYVPVGTCTAIWTTAKANANNEQGPKARELLMLRPLLGRLCPPCAAKFCHYKYARGYPHRIFGHDSDAAFEKARRTE
jgi:hypothetical protein